MTSPMLYAAETWEKVYKAFEEINFTAYDVDAVKQSLLDYLKIHYPENFNDYVESSQLIAIVEMFAYVAEILAYRVDLSVHENLLSTASRKQSVLRLARLISYTATRNLPLRGLVKITSVSVSEDVRDSQGNSLANRVIRWADPNNPLWREQFFLVFNRLLTQKFGSPIKSFQVDDTVFQKYEMSNLVETESNRSSFNNGVIGFKVTTGGQELPFELVPADVDQSGVFERAPNPNAHFTVLYADDGYGDQSDTTGFMGYIKQGTLFKLTKVFDFALPNRILDVDITDVNDVDVWVQEIDDRGATIAEWENVPSVSGSNLAFNNIKNLKKYEIETLEDDRVRIVFGDGDFSEIPTGIFNVWVRQSTSGNTSLSKNEVSDQSATFIYTDRLGKQESCTLTYSLSSALQNSSMSEDIEHIRAAAPAVYYTQNRMVNGQDYNSFLLRDPSILRLKAVNRTFAGQPKYLDWNDASGAYQNVKLFGDDLRLYYGLGATTEVSQVSSRALIDRAIEPALSTPGIYNLIVYAFHTSQAPLNLAFIRPRTRFIEDSDQRTAGGDAILEKTELQGVLDRHWYGEPDTTVMLDSDLSESSALQKTMYAVVNSDADGLIYDQNLKLVTKDPATGIYTAVPVPGGASGIQEAALRQKRFAIAFDPDREFSSALRICSYATPAASIPEADALPASEITQRAAKEETWTVEVVDASGTFTVYGSLTGYHAAGKIGEAYSNGIIRFLIGFPPGSNQSVMLGDAFIIDVRLEADVYTPTVYKKNLCGQFKIIGENLLPADAETAEYDVSVPERSWVMIVKRADDEHGNVAYWEIVKRNFGLIAESTTTKFWYNSSMKIVDPETKKPVHDVVKILKSNLTSDRSRPIGDDQPYQVVGDVKHPDGEVNHHALSITSTDALKVYYSGDGAPANPLAFLQMIGQSDYVYFLKDAATGRLTPVKKTPYLESLTFEEGTSGNYVRARGREGLDFMWQHFTPSDHLIDPSTSNIIDLYVLTRGYYVQLKSYLRGAAPEPQVPSSLSLRNSYKGLLASKMISDTVILHPGKVKLLFGSKAIPELRAKFRIVRAPGAKLTGDQIRARTLDLINRYFEIEHWDFGQSFYATELCAVIHQKLATEVSSVVLVPEFPSNYFGDLFFIRAAPDEVLMSAAEISNIEIVSNVNRLTLKAR